MKYAFIAAQRSDYSLKRLCTALNVSRSGFYAWRARKPSCRQQANEHLIARIKQIHQRVKETYGSPRMHAELISTGIKLSRNRIERLMRKAGIQAKQSKRHRSDIEEPINIANLKSQ